MFSVYTQYLQPHQHSNFEICSKFWSNVALFNITINKNWVGLPSYTKPSLSLFWNILWHTVVVSQLRVDLSMHMRWRALSRL